MAMTQKTIETGVDFDTLPAALFVQTASKFKSRIELKTGTKTINAKSIMGLFALNSLSGGSVTIVANGEDEEQAIEALSNFLIGEA